MTTVKLPNQADAKGRLAEIFGAITRREERVFGARHVSNVWMAMAHLPEYLEATWNRSRAITQRGRLPPIEKELVYVAVSAVNGCHY